MGLTEENSKDWQTHFILATLYAEIEQLDRAINHFEAVPTEWPEHEQALEWMSKIETQL